MSPDLSLDHILEVEEKINNAERKNQFIELLKNDQKQTIQTITEMN